MKKGSVDILAQRYARSLFSVAKQLGKEQDLEVADVFSSKLFPRVEELFANRDARWAMTSRVSPAILKTELLDLALQGLTGEAVITFRSFLMTLIEAERAEILPFIFAKFRGLLYEAKNILQLKVMSAFELSDSQRESLVKNLSSSLKKEVSPTYSIKKDLVAGIYIEGRNFSIDCSLKGKIHQLCANIF